MNRNHCLPVSIQPVRRTITGNGFFFFFGLLVLSLIMGTTMPESAVAATSAEWEAKVAQWEQELIEAQQEINRIRDYPRFRNQEIERDKREKLIYWSQKAVTLRDKIAEAKTFIVILKEKERYQQVQAAPAR
jgi:hypothetical protein